MQCLPVLFIIGNIVILYGVYLWLHLLPMMESEDQEFKDRGVTECIIFHVITLLLVISYIRCIITHPGTIPDIHDDPRWAYEVAPDAARRPQLQESKKSGDRRHCKWCTKYKPDRCHHCRVCQQCILKMDHHCPWICNCVGFKNHKYFFLLLFYTVLDTQFITWTMMGTVRAAADADSDIPVNHMFLLLFGETLAAFLAVLVTCFFTFHIYLALKAMTTIEFCEKAIKKNAYETNLYDRGCCGNLKAVLGDYVILWPFPVNPPGGNGIDYNLTEQTPFRRSLETGRRIKSSKNGDKTKRRKSHWSAGTGAAPESEVESAISDYSGQDNEDPFLSYKANVRADPFLTKP